MFASANTSANTKIQKFRFLVHTIYPRTSIFRYKLYNFEAVLQVPKFHESDKTCRSYSRNTPTSKKIHKIYSSYQLHKKHNIYVYGIFCCFCVFAMLAIANPSLRVCVCVACACKCKHILCVCTSYAMCVYLCKHKLCVCANTYYVITKLARYLVVEYV